MAYKQSVGGIFLGEGGNCQILQPECEPIPPPEPAYVPCTPCDPPCPRPLCVWSFWEKLWERYYKRIFVRQRCTQKCGLIVRDYSVVIRELIACVIFFTIVTTLHAMVDEISVFGLAIGVGLAAFLAIYYFDATCNPLFALVRSICVPERLHGNRFCIGIVTFLAQIGGALFGAFWTAYVFGLCINDSIPFIHTGIVSTGVSVQEQGILLGSALMMEVFGGTIFALIFLTNSNGIGHFRQSLAVGLVVALLTLMFEKTTGAGFNMLMHFAPAIVALGSAPTIFPISFELTCWIYYVAPLIGVVIAIVVVMPFEVAYRTMVKEFEAITGKKV